MAGLRQTARALAAQGAGLDRAVTLTELAVAVTRADPHRPGLQSRPVKDLDAVAARVISDLAAGRGLSRADLADAAWCLWSTRPALADDDRLLATYLRLLLRQPSPRAFRSLASSYVVEFRRDRPAFALVGRALAMLAPTIGPPWTGLQDTLGLFDPDTVLRRLTDRTMQSGKPPATHLEALRSGPVPRGAGLLLAVHSAGLERLRAVGNEDPVGRLGQVMVWSLQPGGRLLAPELAPLVVDALLAPFRGETPDQDLRDRYLRFLLSLVGDPRLVLDWPGRNPKGEAILRRWLTEQTLRMYLDVVARLTPPEDWAYRRVFWESLYRASLVEDAWVVFDAEGASAALRTFGDQASFARFPALADVPRGGAVLMLKIAGHIVIDWSHGGPAVIWGPGEGGPALFRPVYEPAVFRKAISAQDTWEGHAGAGVFWHSGLTDYIWQDAIAARLRPANGGRLTAAAYRL